MFDMSGLHLVDSCNDIGMKDRRDQRQKREEIKCGDYLDTVTRSLDLSCHDMICMTHDMDVYTF